MRFYVIASIHFGPTAAIRPSGESGGPPVAGDPPLLDDASPILAQMQRMQQHFEQQFASLGKQVSDLQQQQQHLVASGVGSSVRQG